MLLTHRVALGLALWASLWAGCPSAPPAPPPSPTGGGSREGHAAQGQLLGALAASAAEILKIGMGAQKPDQPVCQQGHAALVAMTGAMQQRLAGIPAPPDREAYLAACAALPTEVQACLRLERLITQASACDAALGRATPAAQESFATLAGRTLFKGK